MLLLLFAICFTITKVSQRVFIGAAEHYSNIGLPTQGNGYVESQIIIWNTDDSRIVITPILRVKRRIV